MYQTHFGLQKQPFRAGDAVLSFFESASVQAAIPQLRHALRSDPGVAVLTGPAGSGKSCLLRYLQQNLMLDGRACLCSAASLESPADLLEFLATASLQPAEGEADTVRTQCNIRASRWSVREKLRRSAQFWGPVLLLLDDAQLLPVPVLNELKSLVDEGSDAGPLLRTLIAGPLHLEEQLARPTHTAFGHRVRCHVFLEPLTVRESAAYLQQQIELAGGMVDQIFSREAVEVILQASEGIPRCINLLADETLLEAAERDIPRADGQCVQAALRRLIHLPYEWDMSAMQDGGAPVESVAADDFVTDDEGIETGRTSATELSSGVVEFGSPSDTADAGVTTDSIPAESADTADDGLHQPTTINNGVTAFEIGVEPNSAAPVSTPASVDESSSDDIAEETAAGVCFENEEPASAEVAESVGEALQPAERAFEVGYSFEASEIGDAQEFHDSDIPAGHTLQEFHAAESEPPFADPSPSAAVEVSDTVTEDEAIGTESGDAEPVFDRYTWIALNRELPPQTQDDPPARLDLTDPPGGQPAARAHDSIEIHESSDSEIAALLQSPESLEAASHANDSLESPTEWRDGQLLTSEISGESETNEVSQDGSPEPATSDDQGAASRTIDAAVAEEIDSDENDEELDAADVLLWHTAATSARSDAAGEPDGAALDHESQDGDVPLRELQACESAESTQNEEPATLRMTDASINATDDAGQDAGQTKTPAEDVWYRPSREQALPRAMRDAAEASDSMEFSPAEKADRPDAAKATENLTMPVSGMQIDSDEVARAARRLLGLDQLNLADTPAPEQPHADEGQQLQPGSKRSWFDAAHGHDAAVPTDRSAIDAARSFRSTI
jgi:type II secretory pathway predicted ATPase ExeA